MKKLIVFLFLIGSLTSCYKIIQSEPIVVKGSILNRQHADEKTEWTYHYGYSVMNGKFCMHYGPEEIAEKNIVTYTFLNDTCCTDSKYLYSKAETSNELTITYVEIYHVKKEVKTFVKNDIIKIE